MQITTVGYGDVTPDTPSGKIFTIFYTLTGCALAAKGFRDVVCYPLVVKAKENEKLITRQFGNGLSEGTLKAILSDKFFDRINHIKQKPKEINKCEFVLLLLRIMSKVEDKDILLAAKIFDQLDTAGDGERCTICMLHTIFYNHTMVFIHICSTHLHVFIYVCMYEYICVLVYVSHGASPHRNLTVTTP